MVACVEAQLACDTLGLAHLPHLLLFPCGIASQAAMFRGWILRAATAAEAPHLLPEIVPLSSNGFVGGAVALSYVSTHFLQILGTGWLAVFVFAAAGAMVGLIICLDLFGFVWICFVGWGVFGLEVGLVCLVGLVGLVFGMF